MSWKRDSMFINQHTPQTNSILKTKLEKYLYKVGNRKINDYKQEQNNKKNSSKLNYPSY